MRWSWFTCVELEFIDSIVRSILLSTFCEKWHTMTAEKRSVVHSRASNVFDISAKPNAPRRKFYNPSTGTEMLDCCDVRDRIFAWSGS
jgi:hypothetical protein